MPDFSQDPFLSAIKRLTGQTIMPTSAGTYGLEQLPAAVRERAFFSARVTNADLLQQAYDLITRGVSGGDRDSNGNYIPGSSLKDLSSDKRLEMIYRTNVEMAQGYGTFLQQQDPASLDAYPAQELYRLEDRKEHRPWGQRWNTAIQDIGLSNTSAIPVADMFADSGMFALVNDPIWTAISRFDLPYPPYDFGSGMWVRDISRLEAQNMGLMAPGDDSPTPVMQEFNTGIQADISDLAAVLQDSLKSFGNVIDGVFHLAK
jgi:hypothetical protein